MNNWSNIIFDEAQGRFCFNIMNAKVGSLDLGRKMPNETFRYRDKRELFGEKFYYLINIDLFVLLFIFYLKLLWPIWKIFFINKLHLTTNIISLAQTVRWQNHQNLTSLKKSFLFFLQFYLKFILFIFALYNNYLGHLWLNMNS